MQKSVYSPEQIALQRLLRILREEAGLRQEDLAAKLGRPQPFVSRYEIGTKMLDLPELRQICKALEITLPELVAKYEKALNDLGLA